MRVSKKFALFGFHFCATIFVGLSVYGLALYMDEGLVKSDSLLSTAAYAAVVLASIAGICFFGREADRRKSEEAQKAAPPAPASAKKGNR
jgi:uncharacterized membrane protein